MAKSRSRRRSAARSAKKSSQRVPQKPPEPVELPPESKEEPTSKVAEQTMDPRSKRVIWTLMWVLLISFVLLAWLAPDQAQPNGNPTAGTVVWRLLLLLIPLGMMYALLLWDRILKLVGR